MPPRRSQPRSARNEDFTDRELLLNIREVYEADGFATTTAIAQKCGFTGDSRKGHTPARYIASRLSWMRDGQLLESITADHTTPYREPGDRDTRWRLTAIGAALADGTLSKSAQTALERLGPGAMVLMMRELVKRGYVEGEVGVAFAIRREYQHNVARRKLKLR